MLGVIGVLALILQVCMTSWDNQATSTWRGVRAPTTLWRILLEWAFYMLMFVLLSVVVQGVLRFTCLIC